MSFLNRISRINNIALNEPKAWDSSLWRLRGSHSASGEVVTEETALTYSAVWCAINIKAGTVASLPLHLMQRSGKSSNIADKDPLYSILHDSPNPYMTSTVFRKVINAHKLSWGNGYAEIVRDGMNNVAALWPIAPNRVGQIVLMEDGQLVYEIKIGGESKWLPRERILHLYGLGFDGFVGYSPIAMARKSIGLGMAMETFGDNFFGNGTHPGVIVTHPSQLKSEAHKNLKQSLTESYSGLGQAHRLMLLEDGMQIQNIGLAPEDSQFLESRQFQIPEIARWFNLPPHKLKDLTKSSFNNIESEQISFLTDSILPELVENEQTYNMQLLTKQQRMAGKYCKHNIEGLLRANSKDRSEYLKAMVMNGMITPNEAREKEDLNPSDDPLADELWMPTGLVPMSKFGEYLAKNGGNVPGGDVPKPEPAVTPANDKAIKLVEGDRKAI